MIRRICAPVIVAALSFAVPVSAEEMTIEDVVRASAPPPVVEVEESVLPDAPPPVPLPLHPCQIVDCLAAVRFARALPPDVLIDLVFEGTGAAERMKKIACREAGMGKTRQGCSVRVASVPFAPACSAKNPRSSASGLFQTLRGWSGLAAERGLSWANVTGPDCLDDVILARAIWDRSGFAPWRLTA